MSVGEIVSLVGVVAVGIGLGITWIRNGKAQARREGEYAQTVIQINEKLDDVCTKANETKDSISSMKERCASTTSTFQQQITTLFHQQDDSYKRLNQLDRRNPDQLVD